jgi:hypothetical protein
MRSPIGNTGGIVYGHVRRKDEYPFWHLVCIMHKVVQTIVEQLEEAKCML